MRWMCSSWKLLESESISVIQHSRSLDFINYLIFFFLSIQSNGGVKIDKHQKSGMLWARKHE